MNNTPISRVEAYCPDCGKMLVTTPDEISGNYHDATVTFHCPFCKAVNNIFIEFVKETH